MEESTNVTIETAKLRIADYLKLLRVTTYNPAKKKKGYTQIELASRIKISSSYLSEIENGYLSISIDLLTKIEEFFDLEIGFLSQMVAKEIVQNRVEKN